LFSVLFPLCSLAQVYTLSGSINDSKGEPMANVSIEVKDNISFNTFSDERGLFVISNLPKGTYQLQFSHVGLNPISRTFRIESDRETQIVFSQDEINIDEVHVTAKESKNISTSSIITRDAMQHLQPSSIADILELLPGGRTGTHALDQVRGINLRTPTNASMSGYSTNSLGTMFSVDGMSLNSQSMIDPTQGFGIGVPNNNRNTSNIGVDMRTIATDNIQSVEIIRGIPSVEYGNLTSGVVLIERINGYEPWSARFKSDGYSKLFNLGKGFDLNQYKLNFDAGYLNSLKKVSDIFNGYKRINASIRGEKFWNLNRYRLIWSHNVDFNTTIDNERFDPDNDYALTDRYNNSVQRITVGNSVKIFSSNPKGAFRNATFSVNVNHSSNQIDVDKLVQPLAVNVLMNSLIAGSHEMSFLSSKYVTNMQIDSRPLDVNLKAVSNWNVKALVKHQIKGGIEYSYAKNLGKGQQYDLNKPLNMTITARPRDFSKIPAMSNLALFAEDRFFINFGKVLFENNLGIRAFTLLNLDNRYHIDGKIYLEPRYNAKLHLPQTSLFGKNLKSNIFAGYGIQTLMPNQNLLYPALHYNDITELSFYPNNPEHRLAWGMTNIYDPTNFNLKPAKNFKWEVGTQFDLEGNTFSINYFNEKMNNGFRDVTLFNPIAFTKYDVNSVDPSTITAKPSIEDFTGENQAQYHSYTKNENGSLTEKNGIEYQFTSRRIKGINTRFTINGAWLKINNRNIQPVYSVIDQNLVTDGKVRQYIASYRNGSSGGTYESFNTNLTADSYLPKLGFNLSVSVQSLWYNSSQRLFRDDLPIGYYDIDQNYHEYKEADRYDPILRNFDFKTDPYTYYKFTQPIDLLVNVKATKVIKEKIRIAMFVNRLFIYKPNYTQHGHYFIRRNNAEDNPYFGMELNIKI
jgi:hypothetical protein